MLWRSVVTKADPDDNTVKKAFAEIFQLEQKDIFVMRDVIKDYEKISAEKVIVQVTDGADDMPGYKMLDIYLKEKSLENISEHSMVKDLRMYFGGKKVTLTDNL